MAYCSISRNAASALIRPGESSIPLQSGSSNAPVSFCSADASDFFIKFSCSVFQEKCAYFWIIHIQPVCLCQTYHIISVFYNPPFVTVFDRMAFKRNQMFQRYDSRVPRAWWSGHCFRRETGKYLVVDKHQIERQIFRAGRIELQKCWSFVMEEITHRAGKFFPLVGVASANDKVQVECITFIAVGDHSMAAPHQPSQAVLGRAGRNGLQHPHNGRW